MRKLKAEDFIYSIVTGCVFTYAVNLSVITATVIQVPRWELFLTGAFMLLLFMGALYNRVTTGIAVGLLALAGLWVWLTWEQWDKQVQFIQELLLLARGMLAYRDDYGTAVVRLICAATGLLTAISLYKYFNFYIMTLSGVSTFFISWLMDYRRDDTAFMGFLLAFCLLLARKMNRRSLSALLVAPICLAAVWLAAMIPGQHAAYTGQSLSQIFNKPFAAVNDFFYLAFNPKYFSFQTTGFAGANENLGGPVAVNRRRVMMVDTNSRAYISGALKDQYTGRSWTAALRAQDWFLDGREAAQIEFLETAAAMIYYGSVLTPHVLSSEETASLLWNFTVADRERIDARAFAMRYLGEDASVFGQTRRRRNAEANALYIYSYLPMDYLRIAIGTSRTGAVFRPAKAADITFIKEGANYSDTLSVSHSGDIKTIGLMAADTEYQFRFLNPYPDLTFLRPLMERAGRGFYETESEDIPAERYAAVYGGALSDRASLLALFDELVLTYQFDNTASDTAGTTNADDNALERFLLLIAAFKQQVMTDYANRVYDCFTVLPETVPSRVYDLAWEIVKDAENDYARVKALEAYLVQIPYTLTPPPVPAEYDFVDYFLFERREGYCTYYASAMAVLSRCVGIPSRYMEGYMLPPEKNADGLYEITNEQAHSWAEVYLEGYGWLPVEATAPYHYMGTPEAGQTASLFTADFINNPQYEEYLRNFGFNEDELRVPVAAPTGSVAERAKARAEANEQPDYILTFVLRLLMFAGTVLTMWLVFWAVQRIREAVSIRRVSKLPPNLRAMAYFHGIMKMTNYYHYPFLPGETPRDYGLRLRNRFTFKNETVFLRDLIGLYYKARYGGKPLTDNEAALLEHCYFEMSAYLQSIVSWPRFTYMRYIRRVTVL